MTVPSSLHWLFRFFGRFGSFGFLGLSALSLAAPAAYAQAFSDPGVAFGLQVGISKGREADAVPVGRLHVRYRVTGMVGVELAAAYRNEEVRVQDAPFVRLAQGQLTGSFLLFLFFDHPVQPFLLGGGGYYYVTERGLGAHPDFQRTEHLFGFHAGGGVDVRVGRRVSVFLDARYTFLGLSNIDPGYAGKADFTSATAGVNLYF
jgi:opacity protein-like surface antigen